MRRSRTTFAFLALLLSCVALTLPGCGGSNAGKVASITLSPSPVSVAYGESDVRLTASAVNSSNAAVSASFTFASSNTAAISVSPTGQICGGTWDANFFNCAKPANSTPQSATITVSVVGQTPTQTVQAYVHEKVDSVAVTSYPGVGTAGPNCATSTNCTCTSLANAFAVTYPLASSGSLPVLQATAFSNDPTVCNSQTPPVSAPCDITGDLTATPAGTPINHSLPFEWASSDTTIAAVDTGVTTAGTVTPIGPGKANISATISGMTSPSVPFVTCPVSSITLTATNASNSGLGPLSISPGGTQNLAVAVTDANNPPQTITYSTSNTTNLALNYPGLSWLSSDLYSASAAAQTQSVNTTISGVTTTQTVPLPAGTATGVTDGVTSLVASCTPPACNKNLFPVYSNPIVTTTSGSNAAVAYIASSQSLVMLAVDVASTALLVAFPLPSMPNSFLFNRQGTMGILGSANGVFPINPTIATSSTTSPVIAPLAFNGTVLAISPDGSLAAVFGQNSGTTQDSIGIINLTQSAFVTSFPIPGKSTDATQPTVAADFSLDSRYLWVAVTPPAGSTAGNRVYVYTSGTGASSFNVNSPANDLAFLASGPLVYLAGDTSAASISARATCLPGQQGTSTQSSGSDLANGVVDVQAGVAPSKIRALPNGAGILALDPQNNIDVVTLANPQSPLVGCPFVPSGSFESVAPQSLGLSTLLGTTVNQFLVTPDSSTAFLTSTGGNVVLVNLANPLALTATAIPLQGGTTPVLQDPTTGLFFKGDIPANSGLFVVGASDGFVHEIYVSTGLDYSFDLSTYGLVVANSTTTPAPPAPPNLIAIRNQ